MAYSRATRDYAKRLAFDADKLNMRSYKTSENERSRTRNDYQRDYARILYSSSFRRLQGKMQMLGVDHSHFYRNRLTHSLEVAQIARSIAADLGLRNHIVAETCALAHDLGNPPFGHRGEVILNELATNIGGFEGNAQTFRIVNRLEKKSHKYSGLNLTLRVLLGISKYFNLKKDNDKFLYNDDYDYLNMQCAENNVQYRQSIDMQIMDVADEIAYAAHDLEDSLSFGYLTIDELLYEFFYSEEYKGAYDLLSELVVKCKKFAFEGHKLDTSEEYSFLFRKELTSAVVNHLTRNLHFHSDEGEPFRLAFIDEAAPLAKGLKKLLFKAVLRKRSIQAYEKKGEIVLRGLFEVYSDKQFNRDDKLLPPEYRTSDANAEHERSRKIIDYISGMMDSFAIKEFVSYFGQNSLNGIYSDRVWGNR